MKSNKVIDKIKGNSRFIIFGILLAAIATGGYMYMQTTKPPQLQMYQQKPQPAQKLSTANATPNKTTGAIKTTKTASIKKMDTESELTQKLIEQALNKIIEEKNNADVTTKNSILSEQTPKALIQPPAEPTVKPKPEIKQQSPKAMQQGKPKFNEFGQQIQSIVFEKDMEIRDALDLLANVYRKNIVPSTKIKGLLAFTKLYDVTFEEAMDAILGVDFKYEQVGNLVKIYTEKEFSTVKRNKSLLIHKVFTLYYITAAEAKNLLSSVVSPDGNISVTSAAKTGVPTSESITSLQNDGGNTTAMNDTIIVCDYPQNMEKIEQIISNVDIRPKQILIEATILSATLTEGLEFGIDWQTLDSSVISSVGDLVSGTANYFNNSSSVSIGSEALEGGMNIGFVHSNIAGFINAVEDITDVTILANPKILAVNKQLGQVYIGKKIAYQSQTTQTDTSTTEQVKFLDTGTKLSFRPYIGDDGYIRMDIHPKDSSATLRATESTTLPDETSAEIVTNIFVKDGQTIAIGGLFRDKVSTAETQVPILGDVPLIGAAFRGKADEVVREEVIVLITPHIITEPNQASNWASNEDVQCKMTGANEKLQRINKIRRAKSHFNKAASYYINGDDNDALEELNAAIDLYPSYLDALKLKEKISRRIDLQNLTNNKNETDEQPSD